MPANENSVLFNNWGDLINALKYDYTTSFKDVCKMLKASRAWVNLYIRPFVKFVYINNNIRGDTTTGINWVQLLSFELGKEMTESIWFHSEELINYIHSSIYSVTKQSKSVPVTFFMQNDKKQLYLNELEELASKIDATKSLKERGQLIKLRNECYIKYIYNDNMTRKLLQNKMSITKRTLAPHTPVQLPDVPITEWVAAHDIKEYGDADETIYRYFFKFGYIKVELRFYNLDGALGRRVFHIADPEPIIGDAPSVIFAECDWQDYLHNRPVSV